jgi:hypothetical protein
MGTLLPIRVSTGNAVAQVVEALRYKPEGLGFDFWPDCGPDADSASNRYEYQENFLGVKEADAEC